jgi:hypothetical protein
MSKIVLKLGDKGATATLVPKDAQGNPATLNGAPVWSMGTAGVAAITPSADGLSASFVSIAPGDTTVNAVCEGDPQAGIDTINATGEIQVLPLEAATVDMNFVPNP